MNHLIRFQLTKHYAGSFPTADSCLTKTVSGVSLGLPGFGDSSFASYPTIEDALFSLHIQLTFLAQAIDDSLLLYDAFNSQGTSDFVALVIKDGYLELRYELGSGRYTHPAHC